MRATTISTLASLLALSLAAPMELALIDKMSLTEAGCQNVTLTEKYVLQADCWPHITESIPPGHISLDLNGCFANYKGTLNGVVDGGFGSSCPKCDIDASYKLTCECATGIQDETMTSTADLDNWRAVRIYNVFGEGGGMQAMCWDWSDS